MSRPGRIPLLVIGGGIGGLATALAVARIGQAVHVLERSPEFGELGAGLQLAPNALRVLDHLGLLEEISRSAVCPRRLVLGDLRTGEELTALDVDDAFRRRYGYGYLVMHRGDLLDVLLGACRATGLVTLEAGREVETVEEAVDEGPVVTCADGTVYPCEAVVGADGLRSAVRQAIVGDGEPLVSPFVAYRGPMDAAAAPRHPRFEDMVIWAGPDRHFVQYLIHHGGLYNQVAVFKSERFGSEDWGTVEELDDVFQEACAPVQEGRRHLWRDRRWPLVDRLPVGSWTRGRVTLLGDAAHCMHQYLAQGACQALEDAVCLADRLSRHDDAGAAFLDYERVRLPRTALLQSTARRFGDVLHAHGLAAELRDTLLARRPSDDCTYVDWLYAYDVRQAEPEIAASRGS
jgi:3-hydroxybenzoate 6-monooxygenase